MPERRGLTIYFIDGTKMKLDYPKQANPAPAKLPEHAIRGASMPSA